MVFTRYRFWRHQESVHDLTAAQAEDEDVTVWDGEAGFA
jgi:hypothetical protein